MRVLVTGGAGFIGSHVVARLLGRGHEAVCLARPTTATHRLAGSSCTMVVGDVRDPADVARAADGCAAILHLASPSSWADIRSPALGATNAGGAAHVIASARYRGARVVFVSSIATIAGSRGPSVFDESAYAAATRGMPYAAAKLEAEAVCRRAVHEGADVVIVNPAEVYGPDDTGLVTASTLIGFATDNPVLVCTGGTAIAHVDDVADGIVAALERGRTGERYILAGENVTLRRLAELTLDCIGRRARILSVPNAALRVVARVGAALRLPLPIDPAIVPYATRYWWVRAAKAQSELGVTFRSARATLEPTVAWLRQAELV